MNLAASLGIRLFDGAVLLPTPFVPERAPGLAVVRERCLPAIRIEGEPAPAQRDRRRRGHRRSVAESQALRERICAAMIQRNQPGGPWESNDAIAKREGVTAGYVSDVARMFHVGRRQRTVDEIAALRTEALRLLGGENPPRRCAVAKTLGVSPAYITMLLGRKRGLRG